MRFTSRLLPLIGIVLASLLFSTPSLAADFTEPTTKMEFVLIKGGSFVMGDITGRDPLATPAHRVTLDDFWLGRYEVTFAQYDLFCEATRREKPKDEGWGRGQRPVIHVSWDDAVAFTEWLSKESGKTFRLPSEAQWEYAARAGTSRNYAWGNQVGRNLANCKGCGSQWDHQSTAPVGSFAPSSFGLYDMVGNVYEWCADARHEDYHGAPTDGSAWQGDSLDRVNRGGSWRQKPREADAFRRCWESAKTRTFEYGFRVMMLP